MPNWQDRFVLFFPTSWLHQRWGMLVFRGWYWLLARATLYKVDTFHQESATLNQFQVVLKLSLSLSRCLSISLYLFHSFTVAVGSSIPDEQAHYRSINNYSSNMTDNDYLMIPGLTSDTAMEIESKGNLICNQRIITVGRNMDHCTFKPQKTRFPHALSISFKDMSHTVSLHWMKFIVLFEMKRKIPTALIGIR